MKERSAHDLKRRNSENQLEQAYVLLTLFEKKVLLPASVFGLPLRDLGILVGGRRA